MQIPTLDDLEGIRVPTIFAVHRAGGSERCPSSGKLRKPCTFRSCHARPLQRQVAEPLFGLSEPTMCIHGRGFCRTLRRY